MRQRINILCQSTGKSYQWYCCGMTFEPQILPAVTLHSNTRIAVMELVDSKCIAATSTAATA